MAIKEIEINTDNLARDITKLKTELSTLQKSKTKMIREIQELNTMWKGSANQAFNIQFDSDCEAFENLCKTIDEMIKAMENARVEYDQCNNKVNSLVTSIRI